jgi:hypothetical protein
MTRWLAHQLEVSGRAVQDTYHKRSPVLVRENRDLPITVKEDANSDPRWRARWLYTPPAPK